MHVAVCDLVHVALCDLVHTAVCDLVHVAICDLVDIVLKIAVSSASLKFKEIFPITSIL